MTERSFRPLYNSRELSILKQRRQIKEINGMRIGALEAGGTKMVLAVYDENGEQLDMTRMKTEDPEITIPKMNGFFRENRIDALGIGCFGPLDLNKGSATYGWITSTPKLSWRNTPILQEVTKGMDIPAEIDTDVNAAAIAEVEEGAAAGCRNAVYMTVGTGIGGGVVLNGQPLHGLVHPEVGHMLMSPLPEDPCPEGFCPYHRSCLEGLASGPAISKRAGRDASELPEDDIAFTIEAKYLAQMCVNLIMTYSPEKIILGGGVMERESLFDTIRGETIRLLGGYIQHDAILKDIDHYIVRPKLYPVSGLVGSRYLGMTALKNAGK